MVEWSRSLRVLYQAEGRKLRSTVCEQINISSYINLVFRLQNRMKYGEDISLVLISFSGCAILDCIQLHDKKTYYCLDLLEYDRTDFSESPFSLRYFMLTSKLAEMTNFGPM